MQILEQILPYATSFLGAFALTLMLTPLVREMNRRLGMVDKPDPRRINKVPIPRGGGLALVIGVVVSFLIFLGVTGRSAMPGLRDGTFGRLGALSVAMAAIGLADDKFSLSPKLKLAGQLAVAFLVWFWAKLGFASLWPDIPAWIDCFLTMCWVVGAVNAFNLIDGLDGLASGLAFIASLGMAGALIFSGRASSALFHFAFAGGLLGFLRYNYNPASVFLGDSGSMFIGFSLAVLPLCSHAPNSFLVSVGVPLLAMGVPIFDTLLAILRRSIRHLMHIGENAAEGQVMTADADHLHHRILRSVGLNQRKAAWILYAFALFFVSVGLVGMSLKSRSAGLWLFALAVASVVVFRDMSSVEFFDAGRLLSTVAHAQNVVIRRRVARLSTPLYIMADVMALAITFFIVHCSLFGWPDVREVMTILPVRATCVFVFLVALRAYSTVWSRAMLSNYLRLFVACIMGSAAGTVVLYYLTPYCCERSVFATTFFYAMTFATGVVAVRTVRGIVRDLFYAIDCSRLVGRRDVSRILVYGSGLRYRTFRRELVRRTAENDRIIVGIIDDDLLLRGHYIGGIRVYGTLMEASEIINRVNADSVVIACEMSPEWMKIVRDTLAPTGVKVSLFTIKETEVCLTEGDTRKKVD